MNLSDYPRELQSIDYYANNIYGKLTLFTKTHIDLQDLVNAGLFGLWQCIDRYEASNEASFHTYAGYRIKGAMIDTIRQHSPFPKNNMKRKTPFIQIPLIEKDDDNAVYELHERYDIIDTNAMDLETVINRIFYKLDGRSQRMLSLHLQGYRLREIGAAEGLSESRASQVVNKAMEAFEGTGL